MNTGNTRPATGREPTVTNRPEPGSSSNEPPRRESERRILEDRFASKLRNDSPQGEASERATADPKSMPKAAHRIARDSGRDDQSGANADSGSAELVRQFAGADRHDSIARSAAGEAFDRALIDRIASRIAETLPGQRGSQFQIDLPAGQLAQAVQLQREPDGSLAIRVLGADIGLAANQRDVAKRALLDALQRRNLRVASLAFEPATTAPFYRNRSSARSRVV